MPNVQLIIKSPSKLETDAPLRLEVPLEGTIRDIKEALLQNHPEHPLPSEQRLIFAGRLLIDGAQTADVLRQVCTLPFDADRSHVSWQKCNFLSMHRPLSLTLNFLLPPLADMQHDVSEPQTFHLMLPIKPSSSGASSSAASTSAAAAACVPPSSSVATASSANASSAHPTASNRAPASAAPSSAATRADLAAQATPTSSLPSAAHHPSHLPAGMPAHHHSMGARAAFGAPPTMMTDASLAAQGSPFLVGGVPHQFVVQQWGGQPFLFALPVAHAFAPPAPFAAAWPGNAVGGWPGMLAPAQVHSMASTSMGLGHGMGMGLPAVGGPEFGGAFLPTVGGLGPHHPTVAAQIHAQMVAAAAGGLPAGATAETPTGHAAAAPPAGGAAAEAAAADVGAARGGVAPAARGGVDDLDVDGEDGQIDAVKLVLKLAFFVYVMGQDGGQQRLLFLTIGAVIIFLAQTGRLDFLQRLAVTLPTFTVPPPPAPPARNPRNPDADGHEGDAGAEGADTAGSTGAVDGEVDVQAVEPEDHEGLALSVYRDLESLIGAFFASLLPTWRPPDPMGDDLPPQAAVAAGAM